MADVIVDLIAPDDLAEIVPLYNQVFRPAQDQEHFARRYQGRQNIVQLVARSQDQPVGFLLGFELKPSVFFLWFLGVLPRRTAGRASRRNCSTPCTAGAGSTTSRRSGASASTPSGRCSNSRCTTSTTSSACAGTRTTATT